MAKITTDENSAIRPTRKQTELLEFIKTFIAENGYSPSYREIMVGQNYTSVATVASHVNNLISRGHLVKRENSARSLEVVEANLSAFTAEVKNVTESEAKWLIEHIESRFKVIESTAVKDLGELDKLYVLVGALKILSLDGAAQAFIPRLTAVKEIIDANPTA